MHAPRLQRQAQTAPDRNAARRRPSLVQDGPLDARPAVVAQRALAEGLNASSAVRGQVQMRAALDRAQAARAPLQRVSAEGVVQRVIYDDVQTLLSDALGGPLNVPELGEGDSALRALWDEAEQQLPVTDVVADGELDRTARARPTPDADHPYLLEYNPNAEDANWLVSSILHELIHVSTAENYEQREGRQLTPWLNLNLPPGLDQQDQDEEEDVEQQRLVPRAVGEEVQNQQDVLEQNLDDLEHVVQHDQNLSDPNWLIERINYARGSGSHLHYDTVLADVLSYLNLRGDTNNDSYRFVQRMTREAADRRLVAPWWGTKQTRRVERDARWYEFWKW